MRSSSLRVLHTVANLKKSSTGLTTAVTRICEDLGACGAKVSILTQTEASSENSDVIPNPKYVNTYFVPLVLSSERWRVSYTPYFGKKLMELCKQEAIEIIQSHGLWLPCTHAAAIVARRLGIPLVILTAGALQPWALSHKALKKRLAWLLYQRRDLEAASLFVARSEYEVAAIRGVGLRQPIAIVPNGIPLPNCEGGYPVEKQMRYGFFLGRLHPSKGLFNLVAAWETVRPQGWRMIVAGPDEDQHCRQLEQAVHSAGLEDVFNFVGPVERLTKAQLFRKADLFILPSFTENFGLVVAEALSYGIPVITTRGTPWKSLETNACGWWVPIGATALADAIRDATSLSPEQRNEMGRRGRDFIEREFSSRKIALEMLAVYDWVLGSGAKPPCIV